MSNSPFCFCMECGSKNLRGSKFCSACSRPFTSNTSNIIGNKKEDVEEIKPAKRILARNNREEDEDDEGISIPENIEGLDFDISRGNRAKTTLRDLAIGQKGEANIRDKAPKVSKKQFLEQWKNEAGPRKVGQSIEVGGVDG